MFFLDPEKWKAGSFIHGLPFQQQFLLFYQIAYLLFLLSQKQYTPKQLHKMVKNPLVIAFIFPLLPWILKAI